MTRSSCIYMWWQWYPLCTRRLFTLSEVDRWSSHLRPKPMTEVCIICFSDKYTVKKSKRKDSLARNQDNVFKRDYVSILQMINLILTSTDTQSTTFHISSLSEDWLHETSIIPTLFSLKCLCPIFLGISHTDWIDKVLLYCCRKKTVPKFNRKI
jgi:hypothetical protein